MPRASRRRVVRSRAVRSHAIRSRTVWRAAALVAAAAPRDADLGGHHPPGRLPAASDAAVDARAAVADPGVAPDTVSNAAPNVAPNAGAGRAPEAAARVRGTATYRERIALPADAVFEATLEDVSRADAPAAVLGRARAERPGNPPFRFEGCG